MHSLPINKRNKLRQKNARKITTRYANRSKIQMWGKYSLLASDRYENLHSTVYGTFFPGSFSPLCSPVKIIRTGFFANSFQKAGKTSCLLFLRTVTNLPALHERNVYFTMFSKHCSQYNVLARQSSKGMSTLENVQNTFRFLLLILTN